MRDSQATCLPRRCSIVSSLPSPSQIKPPAVAGPLPQVRVTSTSPAAARAAPTLGALGVGAPALVVCEVAVVELLAAPVVVCEVAVVEVVVVQPSAAASSKAPMSTVGASPQRPAVMRLLPARSLLSPGGTSALEPASTVGLVALSSPAALSRGFAQISPAPPIGVPPASLQRSEKAKLVVPPKPTICGPGVFP